MAFENFKWKRQRNKDVKQIRESTPQTFEFVIKEILSRIGLECFYDPVYGNEIYSKANELLQAGETGNWLKFLLSDENFLPNKADFLISTLSKVKPELRDDYLHFLELDKNKYKIRKNIRPDYCEFVGGKPVVNQISDDMYEFLLKNNIITTELKENRPVTIVTHSEADWWESENKTIYLPVDPLVSCGSDAKRKILIENGVNPEDKYPYMIDGTIVPNLGDIDRYKKFMNYEQYTKKPPFVSQSAEEQSEKGNN